MSRYPQLENLVGGWFHQDFDLNGDTLEQIIGAYGAVTAADQRRQLVSDIDRFLSGSGDIDDRFQSTFHPDVLPTGGVAGYFGGNWIADWLFDE